PARGRTRANRKGCGMQRYPLYIDNRQDEAASGQWFESYNPYTGEPWAQIAQGNADDVDRAVRAAHRAFTEGPWPQLTASQRGLLLHRLGDLVARDAKKTGRNRSARQREAARRDAGPAELHPAAVLLLRR